MKKICAAMITGIVIMVMNMRASAQTAMPAEKDSVIEPYRLSIAYYKTTNLVFPYAIRSVDRGTRDILAQKAKGVENVLQVKAGKLGFDETNLTVITTDGNLYSLMVNFNSTPERLNIVFQKEDVTKIQFSEQKNNARELFLAAKEVIGKKRMFHHLKASHADMNLKLQGLYISNDVFYFQFAIHNGSNVSYDIDAIRFSIRDKQKAKRTASQENELQPLLQYSALQTIEGKQQQYGVIAVPKFTVPDNKYLDIHVVEKKGGRDLQLRLKNKHIMKAKPVV